MPLFDRARLKTLGAIFCAYLISSFLTQYVFESNTPVIRTVTIDPSTARDRFQLDVRKLLSFNRQADEPQAKLDDTMTTPARVQNDQGDVIIVTVTRSPNNPSQPTTQPTSPPEPGISQTLTPTQGDEVPDTSPTVPIEEPTSRAPTIDIPPTIFIPPTSAPVPPTRVPTLAPAAPTPTRIPPPTSTPVPTLPPTRNVSLSKLGIFVLASVTDGTRSIAQSCPRVLKVIDPGTAQLELVKQYKERCRGGITVLRYYHQQGSLQAFETDNPEDYAVRYFNTIDSPRFQSIAAYQQYFDYLSGPNEFEDLPYPWKMPSEADTSRATVRSTWNGRFWLKLAQLNNQTFGKKTCVLNNPPYTLGAVELSAMIPYLRQIKALGGALCSHDYARGGGGDGLFFYRSYYSYFASTAPDLVSLPLIIGEGGIDSGFRCGYQCASNAETYKQMLANYDAGLRNDSYVLGVTLFQIGNNSDWGSFNLEPIAPWLVQQLN